MLNVTVEWRQEVSSSKSCMSSGNKDVLYAFCCPYSIDDFIQCVRDQAPIYLRYHVLERLHDFRALSLLKVWEATGDDYDSCEHNTKVQLKGEKIRNMLVGVVWSHQVQYV